jgi:NAD(P)-dependent dehydrogenase (short-subunit alcohol dehydrogenase family)
MAADIFSCQGKVAIVTGGCGLIGREIAIGLAHYGALVYVADKEKKTCQNVRYVSLDITAENSVEEVFQNVMGDAGKIDILVNCAYPRSDDWGSKFEDVSYDSWNANLDHHLGGYFIMSKKAAMIMRSHGGGSIVNMASIYGVVAPDFSIYEGTEMTMPAAYAFIKAGIIGMTKYIATYYGCYNVRANTVSPGGIYNGQDHSFVDRYSKKTPLGRMGKPHDIVGAVVYLSSDASSYVTGQNLIVDGGWTAW